MIIVCKQCRASFIVPNSIFANGPRTVRCAKCKSVWKELPPAKHTGGSTTPPPPAQPAKPHHKPPGDLSASAHQENPAQPPETSPATQSNLQVTQRPPLREMLASLIKIALLVVFAVLLAVISIFVGGHSLIIERWPHLQPIYIELGLAKPASTENLVLRNITSERRYIDGAMQLIVTGEIRSHAPKTLVIPHLSVDALGPDGRVIESWRIPPSAATIKPGSTIHFSSSILSPEQTVTEVNLSFVEPLEEKSKE